MNNNKVLPSCYKFNSIPNLYRGSTEKDIKLEIYEYGTDSVEVKLINAIYKKQQNTLKKEFICLILCFNVYVALFLLKAIHFFNIDIVLLLWFMLLIWRLSQLVYSEKIILCHDFGIHFQIQTILGKHNRFVAASNIHDIVINEVLENLDIRYLLILRTKGKLFNKNPVICIFKTFKPTYECLSLIYKHINNVMA